MKTKQHKSMNFNTNKVKKMSIRGVFGHLAIVNFICQKVFIFVMGVFRHLLLKISNNGNAWVRF